ncbi:hypothetical protein ACQPZF_31895 [Actinosynnema sp. CS-041913]|uniref:hypothetical protein n=1 Tax=Actinosynnema sp. CS-041913 TaxID=3239917 RepID=UPI003D92ABB4
MRWVLAVVAVVAVGCTSAPAAVDPVVSAYPVPTVPVRPDERVLRVSTTADGDTAFTLLGLTTGMRALIGSHAEFEAQGQFVRIRMSVINNGRSGVSFDARRHVLLDAQRVEYVVDSQAMTIKRQPEVIDLGANVRLEYDVYYDLPLTASPSALRVFGGPTLTDLKDESGTEILLGQ